MELFDASGKLSQLLLFLLAQFEVRLAVVGQSLHQIEEVDHTQVLFADAEHITAFTKENRRMSKEISSQRIKSNIIPSQTGLNRAQPSGIVHQTKQPQM